MAKALGSIRVRLAGNGQSGTTPASVEFLYQVLMDGVPAHRGLHGVAAPEQAGRSLRTFLAFCRQQAQAQNVGRRLGRAVGAEGNGEGIGEAGG